MTALIIICLTVIVIVCIICFTFYKMRNVEHTDEFLRKLENKISTIECTLNWMESNLSNIRVFMSKYEESLKQE